MIINGMKILQNKRILLCVNGTNVFKVIKVENNVWYTIHTKGCICH